MKTRSRKNNVSSKLVLFVLFGILFTAQSAFAVNRTTPFTVGETLDPGTYSIEPCGPTNYNCYPDVSAGGTYSAGSGLSLVGSTFSLNLPSVGTAGTYGSTSSIPVFTTDAFGRITSTSSADTADISLLGDITGTLGVSQISSLQGNPLSVGSPSSNDILSFDGTSWVNSPLSSFGNINLSVTGSASTNDVSVTNSSASLGGTLSLNIPSAGITSRGLVTSNAQTFGGLKTFAGGASISTAAITSSLNFSSVAKMLLNSNAGNNGDVFLSGGSSGVNSWSSLANAGATTSLNGLTGIQTFATGTSGTDFNIASVAGVHTFNIPDASTTARGLVTTGAQTFGGDKTFANNVKVDGFIGIGTTPTVPLDVIDHTLGGYTASFRNINSLGVVCYVETTGNTMTCSSDQRLKKNVETIANSLSLVNSLRGVTYNWNELALNGRNDTQKHYGFIAQEVESVVPELVSNAPNGYKTMGYQNIVPLLVNAVKDLSSIAEPFATNLRNWFADATNGIQNLYVKIIHSEEVHSNKVYTNQLCVKKSDGSDYCVTGDELEAIVSTSGIPTPTPTPSQNPSSTPDSEPTPDQNQTPDSSPEPTPDPVPSSENPAPPETSAV